MSEGRWSAWDRIPLPYVGFHEAFLPKDETVESMRSRCREEVVERYLSLKGIDEARRVVELESLAREITLRRHHWGRRSVRLAARAGDVNPQATLGWRVLIICTASFGLVSAYAAGVSLALVCALGLVVLIVLIWLYYFKRRRSAAEVLGVRFCPDCGYKLADLRSAIDPASMGGLWIGPKACPECGSPWPLVPPPVFEP